MDSLRSRFTSHYAKAFALLALVVMFASYTGYRFGQRKQAEKDRSEMTDYVGFIHQRDNDECKDIVDQTAIICSQMMKEKCPEQADDLHDIAPQHKLQLDDKNLF